ncbi:MAG: exodeoxyribonuclease III [Dehalococcoidia bacterium]|nr:exodeoxyribonuclease III [Dehalococcoidia bacterium]
MKIATWNVNSVKARIPRVLEFLHVHHPDVLCLQETKTTAEAFPRGAFLEAGYAAVDHSAGQWAGVAILVPLGTPITDVVCGLPGAPLPDEARWIEATVGGVRVASVYVINGRTLDDPMFPAKLEFLGMIAERVSALAGEPLVVAGDFNIAPADVDVYSPATFAQSTHVTPEERGRLRAILDRGLVDAYRHVDADGAQYTWWDYRGGDFHRGRGLRIDLALVSPDLAAALRSCGIDREFRKGPKPSDHAPLILELDR